MSDRIVLGIDPGITGAIAAITPDGAVLVFDAPTGTRTVAKRGGKVNRKELLPSEMARLVRTLTLGGPAIAALEGVQPMRQRDGNVCPTCHKGQGESPVSAFKFGDGYGTWKGILAALGIPYALVYPVRWKRPFDLLGKDKDEARLVAARLYPGAELARKKDVGRADALLLATYLRLNPTLANLTALATSAGQTAEAD